MAAWIWYAITPGLPRWMWSRPTAKPARQITGGYEDENRNDFVIFIFSGTDVQ
jgi:hypothetical protein